MPSAGVRRLALMAALAGSTLREAFQVLISMTFILGFLPLLYLFVAWPIVRRVGGGDAGGALRVVVWRRSVFLSRRSRSCSP